MSTSVTGFIEAVRSIPTLQPTNPMHIQTVRSRSSANRYI